MPKIPQQITCIRCQKVLVSWVRTSIQDRSFCLSIDSSSPTHPDLNELPKVEASRDEASKLLEKTRVQYIQRRALFQDTLNILNSEITPAQERYLTFRSEF